MSNTLKKIQTTHPQKSTQTQQQKNKSNNKVFSIALYFKCSWMSFSLLVDYFLFDFFFFKKKKN